MQNQTVQNPALGVYEAACILGVHNTRMRPMVASGELVARDLEVQGRKRIRVYSLLACEANFQDYCERLRTGTHTRRRRAHVHLRELMLKELTGIKNHIEFNDAISVYTAADIMGVWPTFVSRMALNGHIIGRKLINHRDKTPSRMWIFSKASCHKNHKQAQKMVKQGIHSGRPRSRL